MDEPSAAEDSEAQICPTCGAQIPPGAPEGMCPACLLNADTMVAPPSAAASPGFAGRSTAAAPGAGSPSPEHDAPALDPRFAVPIEKLRELFPDLEIIDLLGAGGMGAVYRARQPRLDRLVALKVLTCPPEMHGDFSLRFEREAQVLARLNHPNIVTIYDFGEIDRSDDPDSHGNLFYFLMEFVDGADLNQMIHTGDLKPEQALKIVPQVCDALQYAHDEGITHRDIKPANILVDKKGQVRIADFGLAKLVGADTEEAMMTGLTLTGTSMGTPHYMAPEQWESTAVVDHRADIYSLGVVFYEMLTGQRPHGIFDPPSRRIQVDVRVDEVVLKAMEKDVELRYQQASEIKEDVTRVVAEPAAVPKRKRGKPMMAMVAGVAFAALLGGGAWWWLNRADKDGDSAGDLATHAENTKTSNPGEDKVPVASVSDQTDPPAFPFEMIEGRLRARGKFEDGAPIDLSKAEGIDDFVQVIATDLSWVGLRANGQLVASDGRGGKPTDVAELLRGRFGSFGWIDTEGHLSIVGDPKGPGYKFTSNSVRTVPDEVQKIGVVDAAWESNFAIARLRDGSTRVWGERYTGRFEGLPAWPTPDEEALKNVIDIATTSDRCATLTADGRLHHWGTAGDQSVVFDLAEFRAWEPLTEIESGWNRITVKSHDGTTYQLGNMYPRGESLIGSESGSEVLAIAGESKLKGTPPLWVIPYSNIPTALRDEGNRLLEQIGARDPREFDLKFIGAGTDEKILAAIWIEPEGGEDPATTKQTATPPTETTPTPPLAGRVRGWGNLPFVEGALTDTAAIVDAIAVGISHEDWIVLRADGTTASNCAEFDGQESVRWISPVCRSIVFDDGSIRWRSGQAYRPVFPSGFKPVRKVCFPVFGGAEYPPVIALHEDGTLSAFHHRPPPPETKAEEDERLARVQNALAGIDDAMDVVAWSSDARGCVVRADGTVICLDRKSETGLLTERTEWKSATGIREAALVGHGAILGLTDTGEVIHLDKTSDMPAGLQNVTSLVAHGGVAAALKDNGRWVAWGSPESGAELLKKINTLPPASSLQFAIKNGFKEIALFWIEPDSKEDPATTKHTAAPPTDPITVPGKPGHLRAMGIDNLGDPIDLSAAEGIEDIVEIRVTRNAEWIALRADGSTIRSDGQSQPALAGRRIFGDSALEPACTDEKGQLILTTRLEYSVPEIPGSIRDVALTKKHGLILLDDGTVVPVGACAGEGENPWASAPAGALRDIKSIRCHSNQVAVLTRQGRVIAWSPTGSTELPGDLRAGVVSLRLADNAGHCQLNVVMEDGTAHVWNEGRSRTFPSRDIEDPGQRFVRVASLRRAVVYQAETGEWVLAKSGSERHPEIAAQLGRLKGAPPTHWSGHSYGDNADDRAALLWIEPKSEVEAPASPLLTFAEPGRLNTWSFGEGVLPDMSHAEGITDFVQVRVTGNRWIALREGGSLVTHDRGEITKNARALLYTGGGAYSVVEFYLTDQGSLESLDGTVSIPIEGEIRDLAAKNDYGTDFLDIVVVRSDGTVHFQASSKSGARRTDEELEAYLSTAWRVPPEQARSGAVRVRTTSHITMVEKADGRFVLWSRDRNPVFAPEGTVSIAMVGGQARALLEGGTLKAAGPLDKGSTEWKDLDFAVTPRGVDAVEVRTFGSDFVLRFADDSYQTLGLESPVREQLNGASKRIDGVPLSAWDFGELKINGRSEEQVRNGNLLWIEPADASVSKASPPASTPAELHTYPADEAGFRAWLEGKVLSYAKRRAGNDERGLFWFANDQVHWRTGDETPGGMLSGSWGYQVPEPGAIAWEWTGNGDTHTLRISPVASKFNWTGPDGRPQAPGVRVRSDLSPPGKLRALGTQPGGEAIDLSRAEAFDDFVAVGGASDEWVALRANGDTVSLKGDADLPGIARIGWSFGQRYALIDRAGKIRLPTRRPRELPATFAAETFSDVQLGNEHGIALTADGRALVFGKRYQEQVGDPTQGQWYGTPLWPMPPAEVLSGVKAIAVTQTHAATLKHDGSLSVFGWEGVLPVPQPKGLAKIVAVESSEDQLNLLDENGQMWRFPLLRNPAPDQPVPGGNQRIKPVSEAPAVSALSGECWRDEDGTWHNRFPEEDALLQQAGLESGSVFVCQGGLFRGKNFQMLLWIEAATEGTTADLAAPKIKLSPALAAMKERGGRLRGWGEGESGKDFATLVEKAAAFSDFTGVTTHRTGLWGAIRNGGKTVSSYPGFDGLNEVIKLDLEMGSAGNQSFALTASGDLHTTRDFPFGEELKGKTIRDHALGYGHYSLLADGSIWFQPLRLHAQAHRAAESEWQFFQDELAELKDVLSVEAVGRSGIALRANGTIVAWNLVTGEFIDSPADLIGVVEVGCGSAGFFAALDREGKVSVWNGPEGLPTTDWGKAMTPPDDLGKAVALRVNNSVIAAQMEDGRWVAWGEEVTPGVIDRINRLGPAIDIDFYAVPSSAPEGSKPLLMWIEAVDKGASKSGP